VRGDHARLCQIIGNLIDNAAKFTNAGKRVTVALATDASTGRARIEVADEGIGIDRAAFARLFQPFSQGDPNLTRANGGLGLGLALVKSLVEMHGGSVDAYSEGVGKGARFVVCLPLLNGVAPRDAEKMPDGVRSIKFKTAPCRILIIEDNADVAESLSTALGAEGHDVRVAGTAQGGLDLAHVFHPDVLLCDIGLPLMDGYEIARRFRADDELRSVYLVAVTGYASEKDREDAAHAGFDRHVPKPPDLEQLSTVLAEVAIRRARNANANSGPQR
jgi:CheY-like chemotaxis protein